MKTKQAAISAAINSPFGSFGVVSFDQYEA
jgi:hypothetical protein